VLPPVVEPPVLVPPVLVPPVLVPPVVAPPVLVPPVLVPLEPPVPTGGSVVSVAHATIKVTNAVRLAAPVFLRLIPLL
jgi:hypothetical protein